MLEKCILARHKAGVYLQCNYLNKFTKIVLWLVGWTQLTTWIVGIVSKTFCWIIKKRKENPAYIMQRVSYYANLCCPYGFHFTVKKFVCFWMSFEEMNRCTYLTIQTSAVGAELFDPIGAFACDNRSFVSVLHAFRAKKLHNQKCICFIFAFTCCSWS